MPTSLFIIFAFIVLLGGVIWRIQISRLGNRLFGPKYSVRYQVDRWVIEAMVGGRTVKYATGGMGFVPALTYLFLESKVSTEFSFIKERGFDNIPEEIKAEVAYLQSKNGFKKLDAMKSGTSWFSTADRVSFLSHPGEGIMLRRFTKFGGDVDFIKKDLESLQRIAVALTPNNKSS